jgi:hypothetical protein
MLVEFLIHEYQRVITDPDSPPKLRLEALRMLDDFRPRRKPAGSQTGKRGGVRINKTDSKLLGINTDEAPARRLVLECGPPTYHAEASDIEPIISSPGNVDEEEVKGENTPF